jgi:amidase
MGFVGWLGTPDTYESDMTTCLRLRGAVLYCKTNVPQAFLAGETFNNLLIHVESQQPSTVVRR